MAALMTTAAVAQPAPVPDMNPAIAAAMRPTDPRTLEQPNDRLTVDLGNPDRFEMRQDLSPEFVGPVRSAPGISPDAAPALQLQLNAPASATGLGLDVGFARRASLSPNGQSGTAFTSGAEVRVGRGLENLVQPFEGQPTWDKPTWYLFAASEDQALVWTPAERGGPGQDGVRLQTDRVEIGDLQTGVAMQANGVQASVSYVERDISYGAGRASENFAGVTLTVRR
jgi:hypothetical protein